MANESTVDVGAILPDLLGTYGDTGNAEILARRLQWRGIPARVVPITVDDPMPERLDLYVLGGGEDAAQELAVKYLVRSGALTAAAQRGAVIFAVCAGLQLLGHEFAVTGGRTCAGLGLLDLRTFAAPEADRAVGEIVSAPRLVGLDQPLTGFENHQGRTQLGPQARPLGQVLRGIGNGDGGEGVVQGQIIGTYLHGPALARNPQLADLLLTRATGYPLGPLDVPAVTTLRQQRLNSAPARARR